MNSEATYENQFWEILRHLFRMNRFFKDTNLGQGKKTREIFIWLGHGQNQENLKLND